MATPPVPRIFISYARDDGRGFAQALRARIVEAGLVVWQDLADMEGGKDWWEQIAALLRRPEVDHLVLVLTPSAVASDIVRREWRFARQEGVHVTPVVDASQPPDFGRLPRALARVHALDPSIDEQWRQLVRILEGPSGQERVPFLAPEPPAGFVARPREYDRLKRALIDGKGDAVAITAALRGAGGYGKTTLAAALANDADIGEAFFHGVLWTTLGDSPGDVIGRLNMLTRSLNPAAALETDLDLARARWREALAEKHCLIVIDDVWRARDLEPFLSGGPDCARLVTTRDEAVLGDPGRLTMVPVDAMQQGEAAKMLARGFDPAVVAPLSEGLRRLAAAFGEWPLLLNLAHARMARRVHAGHSLSDAMTAAEAAWRQKGIGAFDARIFEARNAAAAASLDLSVLALVDGEGPGAAERLDELGVFAEDQDIPVWLIAALWGLTGRLDPLDGEDLLLRMRALSFFERYDAPRGILRLHDVIRARLRERLGPERLATLDGLVVQTLADRADGDWMRLAFEPYALAHLPMHLAGGDAGLLEATLTDPGWIRSRLKHGIAMGEGVAGLVRSYREYGGAEVSQAVGRVLALVSHDLSLDGPDQVIPQLLGGVTGGAEVQMARDRWRRAAGLVGLFPLRPTLAGNPQELLRLRVPDSVTSVAFSPDGARLATGSRDGTARLWDLATGAEIARLEGHADWVISVAFSPDGARLATGSVDSTARLWDLATGAEIARLEGHTDTVTSVAFSPDEARLASGSSDTTARLWDLATGAEIARFEVHVKPIESVAFSPDGARLATGSDDGTARLWDLATGAEIARLEGHEDAVESVAFSPDGARLATGSDDHTARLWDLATGAEIARFEGHEAGVWSVAFSPDGARLATGSRDGTARLWDLATRAQIARLEGHEEGVWSVAFSPDGARLATGSHDRTARLWDLATGAEIARLEGHGGQVISIAFSPDGARLATGSRDGTARLWDLTTGAEIARLEGHGGQVISVAFSPEGARLATGSSDNTARLWDLTTGAEIARLEGDARAVTSVAFSPDGARLATGSVDSTARLWDLATRAQIARLEGHEEGVWSVAFSPDGARLATGSDDRTARLWDLATGAEIAQLQGNAGGVLSVAFSSDGARLATGSLDNTARIWDLGTGVAIGWLRGNAGGVNSVAFSPDGARLATGSSDRTARLWDLASGAEIARFRFPTGVTSIAVSPGGRLIAVAAGSGHAHVLEIAL